MQKQPSFIYSPIEPLKQQVIRLFESSSKKHLLITGSKGVGKTTLCDALVKGHPIPGVRSYAQRDCSGIPTHIFLQERTGTGHCCIGTFTGGAMQPHTHAFDTMGVQMLSAITNSPVPWVLIDEIGFLEQSSSSYLAQLEHLFNTCQVIAVLRKADTPFLCMLRSRADCFVFDLDEWQGRI